ncbi:MAG: glycosyltransferase [Oscillospiraceae bacterium]|nr:glycosyltransferase [Oscillospiraceae bacterium]
MKTKNKVKISIIVPVFRTEAFLRRCVDSILSQTFRDWELLLIDDGSDDGAPAICDEYTTADSRIRVIHKPNGGLSSARNTGLDDARGEYVTFIDSDDFVAPEFLETLLMLAESYGADVSRVDYREVYSRTPKPDERHPEELVFTGSQVEKAFLYLNVDSVCVSLYKREMLGDLRFPLGKTSEDIPFNFTVFRKAKKVVYLPRVLYYYYHNPNSISNGSLDQNKLNYLFFREEIYRYYEGTDDKALSGKAEALYARAAMGLQARMALFGISPELEESKCLQRFKSVFHEHKNAFYRDKSVPVSRKLLAVLVIHFYPVAKLLRCFFRIGRFFTK